MRHLPSLGQLLTVLTIRNFRYLWFGQLASKIAENFLTFTLVILLHERTDSTFLVSVLVALVSIPPILFSAVAGVVADSVGRRRILLTVNGIRVAILAVLIVSGAPAGAILLMAFCSAVVAQFYGPAETASIPTLVEKKRLFAANSYHSFTNYAAFLVGYTAAGLVYDRYGYELALLLPFMLYAIAMLCHRTLPPLRDHLLPRTNAEATVRRDVNRFGGRLREGIRFVLGHPVILFVILQVAVVFSIERSVISLLPSFSEQFLGFSVSDLSFFLILPTGVGTVAGVLVANRLKRRRGKQTLITIGMLLDGIALLALAWWPTLHVFFPNAYGFIIVLAFLSGFADPFIIVPAQTTLHERAPAQDHGRVFGALYTVINAVGIVPVLVIGLLASTVPLAAILTALALAILAMTVAGTLFYRRHPLGAE